MKNPEMRKKFEEEKKAKEKAAEEKRKERARLMRTRQANENKARAGEMLLKAETMNGEVSGTADVTRVIQLSNMLAEPACGDMDDYDCQTSNLSTNQ